jgi:vacuolar-type H+-ATPase subunit F/Vma7
VSYQVQVLCRPEAAAGFALAGFRPVQAESNSEGAVQLRALLAKPEVGVIVVDERFLQALDDEARRRIAARPLPLVVPFPGPNWAPTPSGPDAYIIELLRQAIGYRVRLV